MQSLSESTLNTHLKAIKWVPKNSLKKLINEGQWKVIFFCYCIEPPVIYAYPPSSGKVGRHILTGSCIKFPVALQGTLTTPGLAHLALAAH